MNHTRDEFVGTRMGQRENVLYDLEKLLPFHGRAYRR